MKDTIERVNSVLKGCGYKLTPQRRAIIKIIIKSKGYMTPSSIYEKALKNNSNIGLVTVYRTLEMLSDMSLLCTVQGVEGQKSYTLSRSYQHHHHLVCSGCGKVVDFAGCNLAGLEDDLSRKTGFKIENHVLELHGRCRECQALKTPGNKARTVYGKQL